MTYKHNSLPDEDCRLIGLQWVPSNSNELELTLKQNNCAPLRIRYSWVEDLRIDLRLETVFSALTKCIVREGSSDSKSMRLDFGSHGMISFKCKEEMPQE